jgi:hypothetical protein
VGEHEGTADDAQHIPRIGQIKIAALDAEVVQRDEHGNSPER